MKINVHIERLILDALPLEQGQGPHVQATVEQELTRLLTDRRSTPQFNTGRTLASVKDSSIPLAEPAEPIGLGKQIAAAINSGLGGRP